MPVRLPWLLYSGLATGRNSKESVKWPRFVLDDEEILKALIRENLGIRTQDSSIVPYYFFVFNFVLERFGTAFDVN